MDQTVLWWQWTAPWPPPCILFPRKKKARFSQINKNEMTATMSVFQNVILSASGCTQSSLVTAQSNYIAQRHWNFQALQFPWHMLAICRNYLYDRRQFSARHHSHDDIIVEILEHRKAKNESWNFTFILSTLSNLYEGNEQKKHLWAQVFFLNASFKPAIDIQAEKL